MRFEDVDINNNTIYLFIFLFTSFSILCLIRILSVILLFVFLIIVFLFMWYQLYRKTCLRRQKQRPEADQIIFHTKNKMCDGKSSHCFVSQIWHHCASDSHLINWMKWKPCKRFHDTIGKKKNRWLKIN